MQGHLTEQQVETYRRRAIAPGERSEFDRHLAACDACLRRVGDEAHSGFAFAALTEAFLSTADEEPFHLSREELKRHAEGSLDQADRIIFESHLEDCAECASGAREFILNNSRGIAVHEGGRARPAPKTARERFADAWRWRPSLRPAQVGAIAAVCLCVLLGMFWFQSRTFDERNQSALPQVAVNDSPSQNQSIQPSRDDRSVNQPGTETAASDVEKVSDETANVASTSPQQKEVRETTEIALTLMDGNQEVTLDKRGKLTGLEGFDPSIQREIRAALSGDELKRPPSLDELAAPRIALLNQSAGIVPFALLNPTRAVSVDDRPAFRWRPLAGATSYTVSIFDSNFDLVLRSDPQIVNQWSPPTPLQRGRVYFWEVTASKDGQEITSPVAPAPRAKFKILEAEKLAELSRVKRDRPASHLALGVLYARAGLLDDAEREFKLLVNANPRSPIASRLLRRVRSWKKP